MNTLALKKIELANLIYKLNIKEIEEILNMKKDIKPLSSGSEKKNLAGIWKDAGIDIDKVEKELKEMRKGLKINLDNKKI